MDNIKHIKTLFTKNDTFVTLSNILVLFIFPLFVFSFCYSMQNSSNLYAIKNVKTLERDLGVVSVDKVETKLVMLSLN